MIATVSAKQDFAGDVPVLRLPGGGAALEQPARAAGPVGESSGAAHRKRLEKTAQTLVAQTFFGTLLKQMRESPFRSELFDGGRGGQAFGSLYDQHLAERMARGAGTKLVRAIVRKFDASNAYARQRRPVGATPRAEAAGKPADPGAADSTSSGDMRYPGS